MNFRCPKDPVTAVFPKVNTPDRVPKVIRVIQGNLFYSRVLVSLHTSFRPNVDLSLLRNMS